LKLLVDANNILYGIFFVEMKLSAYGEGQENNFDLVTHIFLQKILRLKSEFKVKSMDVFLCFDHKNNWRKEIFPNYKESRARARRESDINYENFFKFLDVFQEELKENFPFFTFKKLRLEADDWIACFAEYFNKIGEDTIVISTDKDFHQLQKFPHVRQYNHVKHEMFKDPDPKFSLQLKVLCGDSGDGIPNILSPDDVFITEGTRQKKFGEKKATAAILENKPIEVWAFENGHTVNYKRNNELINFEYIPEDIKEDIILEYVNYKKIGSDIFKLNGYFKSRGLKALANRLSEF